MIKIIIIITADTHGYPDMLKDFVNDTDADYFLDCGDISLYQNHSKPVYFIHGNHENWDIIEAMDNDDLKLTNLRHIKNSEVITLTKGNEKPIRVLGFGGNYSPTRFNMKKNSLTKDRRRHYNFEEFNNAKKLKNKADIVLTHECPFGVLVRNGKDVGSEIITLLLKEMKPKMSFSGHHHHQGIKGNHFCSPRLSYGYYKIDTIKKKVDFIENEKKYDFNGVV